MTVELLVTELIKKGEGALLLREWVHIGLNKIYRFVTVVY
jgi:hypothetical protein